MTSTSPKLPPLPAASEPMALSNGQVNPNWYSWLKAADTIIRRLREEV
jgi:hypothetical protein